MSLGEQSDMASSSTKINIVVGSAPATEEDEDEDTESSSAASKSTKLSKNGQQQHFHHSHHPSHHSHGHHHHRHRHHRFVPKKLDLSSVDLEDQEHTKSKRRNHHTKYRRSASITTSNHSSELDKLRKKAAEASNPCWKDTLSVSDANQLPEGASHAGAGAPGAALPRTLSTSVLRIKHRRTFWERCAR